MNELASFIIAHWDQAAWAAAGAFTAVVMVVKWTKSKADDKLLVRVLRSLPFVPAKQVADEVEKEIEE